MKAFRYASPYAEHDVVALLGDRRSASEVLAGGTDLVSLMKQMIVTPELVVSVTRVDSMRGIQADSGGVTIGAATTLDELLDSPHLDDYQAVKQAIRGIGSMQLQCQGTLGGELCQRPRCWYFRRGQGLLAEQGRLVAEGENRYHAIFGNAGPAKFVSASRVAPALIALGARVRVIGPAPTDETVMPVEFLYRTPKQEGQRETILEPRQIVTHVHIPPAQESANATYEVHRSAGPEDPLTAAAAALTIHGGMVQQARIVLGQVAPTPWISDEAAQSILGHPVNEQTALDAGHAAVSHATPLSDNRYKVQLARVSVQRAILLAAGLETGGF